MAKFVKRATALILAMILVFGQIAPARADDSAAEPVGTVDLTPTGEPTETLIYENTTETTNDAGNVTETHTEGKKEVETPIQDGTIKDTVEYESTLEVDTQPTHVSASETGEENTDTDINVESEEITENKDTGTQLPPTDENPDPEKSPVTNTDNSENLDDETQWKAGETLTNTGTYGEESIVSDTEVKDTVETDDPVDMGDVTPSDHLVDDSSEPEAERDDVKLVMAPGGSSGDVIHSVSVDDIKNGLYPDIFDPNTVPDGATVTITEHKENGVFVGWLITTETKTTSDREPATYTETPGTPGAPQAGAYVEVQEHKDNVDKGVQTKKNDEGKDVKYWTETIDKEGKKGYKEVEEVVTSVTTTTSYDDSVGSDETNYPTTENTTTTSSFELPSNVPSDSTTDNGDGTKTVVTVTNLFDTLGELTNAGDKVGYTVTTITYDADGNVIEKLEQDVFGTATTTSVTTKMDPTTKEITTTTTITERDVKEIYTQQYTRETPVTVTKTEKFHETIVTDEDTYRFVQTNGGMYFVYNGTMSQVTGTATLGDDYTLASATVKRDENGIMRDSNGNIILEDNTVLFTGEDLRILGNPRITDNYTGQTNKWDGVYDPTTGKWMKIGSGLYGGFLTWDENATGSNGAGRHTPQQYMIFDGTNVRFVYCVELNTPATTGTYYASDKKDGADTSAPWTNAVGTNKEIGIVATNGFWGTANGLGSLDAVKDLLIAHDMDDVASRLTEGKAMAATQLAIWKFGNTSTGAEFVETYDENGVAQGDYVTWDDSTNLAPTDQDQQDIAALRNLLIGLAEGTIASDSKVVQQIQASSITGGEILLKENVVDSNGNTVKDTAGNAAYKGNVSFKIEVSKTSITGDLILELKDENGNPMKDADGNELKYRLAGQDGVGLFDFITKPIEPDENGMYTLTDVPLFANQKVTLNLRGVQHLDEGIYIYSNPGQQDFVGLATKKNNLNLSFDMKFTVTDPSLNHSNVETTEVNNYKAVSSKTEYRTDTIEITFNESYKETETDKHHEYKILGTETVTTKRDIKTKARMRWERYGQWSFALINGEDPGPEDPGPEDIVVRPMADADGNLTIIDEEVPLAAVAVTGDNTVIFGILAALSLAGYVLLSKKKAVKI